MPQLLGPSLTPSVAVHDKRAAAAYLSSLAAGSRRTMRAALDTMAGLLTGGLADAETMDWSRVERAHGMALRATLLDRGLSPSTVNKHLAALRGVLREAWRAGLLSAEQYHSARDLEIVKSERLPRGRALTPGDVRALAAACQRDADPVGGARDAALLAVLYSAGLRRSEAVALDLSDYNRESGELVIRGGKGRKDRTVYVTNGAELALSDWLSVRGDEPGALFLPVNRGGVMTMRRLTDQAVLYVLERRAAEAGVKHVTPHDLRRTCISDMLDAGVDLATVQRVAGHSSPTTTARYDRRGEEAKRRAAQALHFPYSGRAASRP